MPPKFTRRLRTEASTLNLFSLSFLLSLGAPLLDDPPPPTPVTLRGKWVLDREGRPSPQDSFKRGLQPSGLVFRAGELWSVGDQRSEYPGHLFRIDPSTGRLVEKPIPLEVPPRKDGESAELEAYRGIRNSDFEGLALHPTDSGILFAVTEDKIPWIVEIHLEAAPVSRKPEGASRARIAGLARIEFPEGLEPWRRDLNFRFEGCAVSDDGTTLYLAYERARDELPRLYRLPLAAARSGGPVKLEEVPIPFASVPARASKARAKLNLNDIQFLRVGGQPMLVAILRDQERILLIDLDRKAASVLLDLDLRDPDGTSIEWVSPEGIALDPAGDRLFIVNDPDSVERNYRARGAKEPAGQFASYTPLLFELKLGEVLGSRARE